MVLVLNCEEFLHFCVSRHCKLNAANMADIQTPFTKDQYFCLKHLFTGVRSVQVARRELGTSGENSRFRHRHTAQPAGGDVHRVLQQHSHHHPLPANLGLNGTQMSTCTHRH